MMDMLVNFADWGGVWLGGRRAEEGGGGEGVEQRERSEEDV